VIRIEDFEPQLASALPATHALLKSANLMIHPAVARIILHGSRCLAGEYRPSSDIDLSLIVETPATSTHADLEPLLHEVFEATFNHWRAIVEPDLAIVFDIRNCMLKCFDRKSWDEHQCLQGGVDCFGLYKVQKGFNGLVTNASVQVKLMYPCFKIWQRV